MSSHSTRIVTAPTPGGPEALKIEHRELKPAGPGEVLIDVAAAGVNRPDVFERMGFYPAPPGAPEGLGLEVSGTVRDVGPGTEFKVGDRVVALVAGGGYADIARADAGSVLPAPEGLDLVAAAGLPETVFTVFSNVFMTGKLAPGETFLVHGGASGIGTTAVQMAKAHGARVLATAGSPEKCALVKDLGADAVFNYREDDWASGVKDAGGADVVLDMVGGDYVQRNLSVMNTDARLIFIAFLKGARAEVDFMRVMLKRLSITGSTLRSRPAAEKAAIAAAAQKAVWPWVSAGKVKPVIDSIFRLDDVSQAHARMDSMAHAGKILLTP
jgi:NADPH2:quinone reductase